MNDTQAQLERLRQLDVDVDELLDAAARLAEIRRDVRKKATETPLPGHLSRILVVPDVDEDDVDPVGLLKQAVRMVRHDGTPALALAVASYSSIFFCRADGPAANAAKDPGRLFSPAFAAHVSKLLSVANRPAPARWTEGDDPRPAVNDRLAPLPAHLSGLARDIAARWSGTFEDPQLLHDWLLSYARAAFAPPQVHVDLEDLPIGAPTPPLPPPAETQEDARYREGRRVQAEASAVLVLRHSAVSALRQIARAVLAWHPADEVSAFRVRHLAETFPEMKPAKRDRLLAALFGVSAKTVRRKLDTHPLPHVPKTPPNISTPGAQRTGRKQATHDEDQRPKPPPPRRPPPRLPQVRPARVDRDQRVGMGKPDLDRPSQSPPHRKDRPRQPG